MDVKIFAQQIFTFFGYGDRFAEVFEEQRKDWQDLIEHAGFKDESLADKYRHAFYAKTVNSPFAVYSEFSKFIVQNPRIREEHYETQHRTWGECPECQGAGHVGPIPVWAHESRAYVFLDPERDERIRQQLARRANALFFELREFGHAKLNGSISRTAYEALRDAANNGRFVSTLNDLQAILGPFKRVYRKCVCDASIKYAGLELATDDELTFLKQLAKQKQREIEALFNFHGIEISHRESVTDLNKKLQRSQIGLETDAIYSEPFYGKYDPTGHDYNRLRTKKLHAIPA